MGGSTQGNGTSGAPPTEERRSTPAAGSSVVDRRAVEAWCAWLDALATDAEAALAAAMAYKDLDGAARETWLSALDQDAGRVGVPRVAMYAPLLAVEFDPARRARITAAIGKPDPSATPTTPAYGLRGLGPGDQVVVVLVAPLYLDFVQVLACGFSRAKGFVWVRHDPIVARGQAPRDRSVVEGTEVELRPLAGLIDELALVILAQQRAGKEIPDALRPFADLFSPGEIITPPLAP